MYVHTCAHTVHTHVHVYMCLVRACLAFIGAEGDQTQETVRGRVCGQGVVVPTLRLHHTPCLGCGGKVVHHQVTWRWGGGWVATGVCAWPTTDSCTIPLQHTIGFNMLFSILLLVPNTGCSCSCTLYMHIH